MMMYEDVIDTVKCPTLVESSTTRLESVTLPIEALK
jgi:hypothetical protein